MPTKYPGMYGEVVKYDVYKLKMLPFTPDLILDIGGNIGIFSRFAAELFPNSQIVAVEPDPQNLQDFKEYGVPNNVTLIEKAIGSGTVWRVKDPINGGHATYKSVSAGYPIESLRQLEEAGRHEVFEIDTVTVKDLWDNFWHPGMKTLIKIDIEGAENSIYSHEPSMDCLRASDYLTMEIHNHAHHGGLLFEVRDLQKRQLNSLNDTHYCIYDHPIFYALRREHHGD